METELAALQTNNTRDIIQRPQDANVNGIVWVFSEKTSDGVKVKKARLVARGY